MPPLFSSLRIVFGFILAAAVAWGTFTGSAVGEPAQSYEAVPLPARAGENYQLISGAYATFPEGGVVITEDRIRIYLAADPVLGRAATLDLSIEAIDDTGARPVLQTRVVGMRMLPGMKPPYRSGEALPIGVTFDPFGRLALAPLAGNSKLGRNEPTWFGVRPPSGWDAHDDIPEDAGPLGILGPWTASERWPVRLTPGEILFGTDNWQAARYAVVDWGERDGVSRVVVEYTQGYNATLVGEWFNFLIRRSDGVVSIAYYPPEAARPEEWPTSFVYSEDNPVQVFTLAPTR